MWKERPVVSTIAASTLLLRTKWLFCFRVRDALHYPLLLLRGMDGYHFSYQQVNPATRQPTGKKVFANDFYAYSIMVHDDSFCTILKSGCLFQQFVVNMYIKVETERLRYIRLNQRRLRANDYVYLRDAMRNDANPADVGRCTILPSSFSSSPRYMNEVTPDAITYIRERGRPQLFITFTCNPK